jgi:hypothetical protein
LHKIPNQLNHRRREPKKPVRYLEEVQEVAGARQGVL